MTKVSEDEIFVSKLKDEEFLFEIHPHVFESKDSEGNYGSFIIRADMKLEGQKWRFHKNDKDPFPSKPHGHNYDRNTKLDLKTGLIYDDKLEVVGRIKEKSLNQILELLSERKFDLSKL
jgi:hypothetical protein